MKNANGTLPQKYVDWAADVLRGGTVDVNDVVWGGGQLRFFQTRPKNTEKGFFLVKHPHLFNGKNGKVKGKNAPLCLKKK